MTTTMKNQLNTRTELQMRFLLLKREIGPRAVAWELDYYAIGGGYRVMDGGHTPLGATRRKPQAMIDALDMALDAVRFVNQTD